MRGGEMIIQPFVKKTTKKKTTNNKITKTKTTYLHHFKFPPIGGLDQCGVAVRPLGVQICSFGFQQRDNLQVTAFGSDVQGSIPVDIFQFHANGLGQHSFHVFDVACE